jgi:hypothetical protein
MQLSPREKQIYLTGFLAGAAVEQARGEEHGAGVEGAGAVASSTTIARMRQTGTLQYRFATPVYSSQLDDYYWWGDHRATPIADAVARINGDMLKQQQEVR